MCLFTPTAAATVMAASIGFVHVQPATGAAGSAVTAAATQQHTQIPGYYHMALDDGVVTAFYGGYTDLPAKTLLGLNVQSVQNLLARVFVSSAPGVQTAVDSFLIDIGNKRILVDTGSGTYFGPTTGGLAGNVRASGYQLEQVDAVLLTHLHPDHACGLLTPQGQPAFTGAQVYVAVPEAGF